MTLTKQKKFNSKWLWLIPLFIFGSLSFFLYSRLGVDPRVVPMATVNKPVPAFQLTDLSSDGTVTEKNLPKEPYILNIWGSWCPTCVKEHPFLTRLNEQGVKIVGINYKDEPQAAFQYLAQHGNPYYQVIQDTKGQLGLDLGVTGAPENFIVGSDGMIRGHYVGELTPEVWQQQLAPCLQTLKQNSVNVCRF